MPRPKGQVTSHGWYTIQHFPTGDWLCALRSVRSWGKERVAFLFSESKSDALWYRRRQAAEFYLRMLLKQKHTKREPHYVIVKEESASPSAIKRRKKKAHADSSQDPKDQA